jgi:hypothetical protein
MTIVQYDRARREHVIVMTLDADEAEGIAMALAWNDAGGRELLEAAEECRAKNAPVTVPEIRTLPITNTNLK